MALSGLDKPANISDNRCGKKVYIKPVVTYTFPQITHEIDLFFQYILDDLNTYSLG